MARVAGKYPDELPDAATLYAESLFLLLPRPGALDLHDSNVARILTVLEAALKRDIHHPGACHLYVHTTELTEPQRAEACVEFLGSAVPGASHLVHMPAHTWTRVGRWGDAVRASLQAWQTDQKAIRGDAIVTYPAHDLQMLVYASSSRRPARTRNLGVRAGRRTMTRKRASANRALDLVTIASPLIAF